MIQTVIIYQGISLIGDYVFRDCYSLNTVLNPPSITELHNKIFSGCDALTHTFIHETISVIKPYTFISCRNLNLIETSQWSPLFSSINGLLFNKAGTKLMGLTNKIGGNIDIKVGPDVGLVIDEDECTTITIPEPVTSFETALFLYFSDMTSVSMRIPSRT